MSRWEELYIFDGLSKEEVVYFLMMAETRYVKPKEVIMRENDPSDDCAYYVQTGSLEVLRSEKRVATIGAGDLFWEIALITSENRTATIRALEPTELLIIRKDEFMMLAKKSQYFSTLQRTVFDRIRQNFQYEKSAQ